MADPNPSAGAGAKLARVLPILLLVAPFVLAPPVLRRLGDPVTDPTAVTFLWVFDLCLLAVGLICWARRRTFDRRTFVRACATVAGMYLVVDVGLGVLTRIVLPARLSPKVKAGVDSYPGQPWAKDLFQEIEAQRFGFQSFVLWRRREFHGDQVNVDARRLRKTWGPPVSTPPAARLFAFGGSTMWGTGVRDDATIPSHLAHQLAERGRPVEVQNYGESGYVFSQEVVQLVALLQQGQIPAHVIFYDGVNDVYGAYQAGAAGVVDGFVHNVSSNRAIFEHAGRTTFKDFVYYPMAVLVEHSKIATAIGAIVNRRARRAEAAEALGPEDVERLAVEVAASYERTARLVDALSRSYGFSYQLFWQPVLFNETAPLPAEVARSEQLNIKASNSTLDVLHARVREEVRRRNIPHWHDLSDALAGRSDPVYIDDCHVTEDGTRRVAERMVAVLEPVLGPPPPTAPAPVENP